MEKAAQFTFEKITVRLPLEEKEKLEGIADDENRSMNGQIREWIQKAPQPKKKKNNV
jgi:hypothetical protein